jgi:hypothetical protein
MSSPHDKDDNDTLPRASHDAMADEKPALRGETQLKEVAATSVALEAAIAEDKPRMFSKGMIKLWMIMGIGYLVSTMNGFGAFASPKCGRSCQQLHSVMPKVYTERLH